MAIVSENPDHHFGAAEAAAVASGSKGSMEVVAAAQSVFLRANGFKTFIVSGGGIDFMRPRTEEVYGIPNCRHPDRNEHLSH